MSMRCSRSRGGREPVELLCSRTARPQKDEEGAARRPPCSQNAHDEQDGKDAHVGPVHLERAP